MVLRPGEKLHIAARRFFETDVRRHFVGEVEEVDENSFRISGYVFVLDKGRNEYARRPERRTRVFSFPDVGLIINVLASDVDIAELAYCTIQERLVVTDGRSCTMDIHEFGPTR